MFYGLLMILWSDGILDPTRRGKAADGPERGCQGTILGQQEAYLRAIPRAEESKPEPDACLNLVGIDRLPSA